MADDPHLTASRSVPRTGVVFVTSEARRRVSRYESVLERATGRLEALVAEHTK